MRRVRAVILVGGTTEASADPSSEEIGCLPTAVTFICACPHRRPLLDEVPLLECKLLNDVGLSAWVWQRLSVGTAELCMGGTRRIRLPELGCRIHQRHAWHSIFMVQHRVHGNHPDCICIFVKMEGDVRPHV